MQEVHTVYGEFAAVLDHRIELVDVLPQHIEEEADKEALYGDGWRKGSAVWHAVDLANHETVYVHYVVGALSRTEVYLLKHALRGFHVATTVDERPDWQERILQSLRDPLEPFAGPVRIEDDLETIAVPWCWPVVIVGLRPDDRRSADALPVFSSTFESLADDSDMHPFVTVDASFAVGVFPVPIHDRDHAEQFGEETAHALVDGLMSESFVDARAVWSPAIRSFPELLRTLKRMLYVAHAGEALLPDRRVLSVKGLGIHEMLFALRPPFRQSYADHVLPPQVVLALGAELEQTVMTFVQCDLNMSETARQLYLHRNSLMYRIERIRDLTGYDIRHFEDAVTVWAALMVKRI